MRRKLPFSRGFKSVGAGLSIAGSLVLAACSGEDVSNQSPHAPAEQQEPIWEKVPFSALPGWQSDDLSQALSAFQKSCAVILKKSAAAPLDSKTSGAIPYGVAQDWQPLCQQVRSLKAANGAVRSFVEANFTPLLISDKKRSEGLFTGYYEPEINASRTRSDLYATPFLSKPPDLLTVKLEQFDPSLKGKTIRGRVEAGRFIPYH
ncbi:MAG: MltA domain-containing protein, partial [Parvibaculaceae bacterium]|nr:MltA domain-containing protein [Parvibaculaceae bacterium]